MEQVLRNVLDFCFRILANLVVLSYKPFSYKKRVILNNPHSKLKKLYTELITNISFWIEPDSEQKSLPVIQNIYLNSIILEHLRRPDLKVRNVGNGGNANMFSSLNFSIFVPWKCGQN